MENISSGDINIDIEKEETVGIDDKLKIMCFNVNGIRAFEKKVEKGDLNTWMIEKGCDIYCIQEIKGSKSSLVKYTNMKNFYGVFSYHEMNGRHGVVTFMKKNLIFCNKFVEISKGRILKTFHGNYIIYNCYMPYFNGNKDGLENEIDGNPGDKIKEIYLSLEKDIKSIKNPLKLIILGDMNAAYNFSDIFLYQKEYEKLVIVNEWNKEINYKIDIYDEKGINLYPVEFYKKLLELEESYPYNLNNTDNFNYKNNTNLNNTDNFNYNSSGNLNNRDNFNYNSSGNLNNRDNFNYKNNTNLNNRDNFNYNFSGNCFKKGFVEKINPSQIEIPYHFLKVETLEKYFFKVWQRKWLKSFIDKNELFDTFRLKNKNIEIYTCWNVEKRLRERNLGSRIDFIFSNFDDILDVKICNEQYGSDHCPITTTFLINKFEVENAKENIVETKPNNLLKFFKLK